MNAIHEALSIAGLGVLVVFAVLALLLLAIKVLGAAAGDRRAAPEAARAMAGQVDAHHLACITAAVRATWGYVPSHLNVRRLG